MCGRQSEEHLDSLIGWLTSPDGLNYNIFRYNIGGGDDPLWRNCEPHHAGKGKGLRAEMEGFLDGADSAYNWGRDEAQQRVTAMIHRRRKDAIFEAFANSAPWWMTKAVAWRVIRTPCRTTSGRIATPSSHGILPMCACISRKNTA